MLTPACQPCQGNTRLYVRGDPSGEAYLNYGLCQTTWVCPVYDYQLQTTVTNTKPSVITVRVHGQSCYTSRLVQVSTRGHEVPCIEQAHRVSLQRLKQVLFLQCLARVRLKWPCASNLYQVWFPPEWAQFRQTSFHDTSISLIQNTVDHLPQRSQQTRREHLWHFQASAYVENDIFKKWLQFTEIINNCNNIRN